MYKCIPTVLAAMPLDKASLKCYNIPKPNITIIRT